MGKRGRINSFAINSSSRERSRGTSKAVPQRLFATTLRPIDFERKSRRKNKDYKESSTPTKVLRKDAGGVLESSTPLVVATLPYSYANHPFPTKIARVEFTAGSR